MTNIIKKIFKLLTRNERQKLFLLFVAMVFSALIEVTGIASIMPFLSLLINPGIINEHQIFNRLYSVLNFQSTNSFLIFIGILVLMILVISNISIALTLWGILRFSWMRDFTISKRLLSKYLHQPYIFFLNKNTSELGKNILMEVGRVVSGVIIPIMQITSKIIITLFIFALLAAIDLNLAIIVIVALGVVYTVVYKVVKRKLYFIGKRRFQTNTARFKSLNEAFGGIKQVKLYGCEDVFIQRYSKPSYEYAYHNATREIISRMPRYLIEIVAFGGIITVILYLLAAGRSLKGMIPIIGLYVFAAYRLMPALQQIFRGITSVRFNVHALDALCKDIESFDKDQHFSPESRKKIKPLVLQNHLTLDGITFTYPGAREPVIRDFNLSIEAHTSTAFVGATGAGKTTIADIILGLLRPQKGQIFVDEVEITDDNLPQWQKNLGYVPQDIYLEDDTVTKNIAYGIMDKEIDMEKVEKAGEIANIHDFVTKELSAGYNTVIGERGIRLSGGERQRIGIARALYHDPQVLIFDEGTNALDGATEQAVFTAIENVARTKTLIIIAHRLNTVKDCNVIYMLDEGRIIAQGTYDELMEINVKFRKMEKVHL